MFEEKKYYCTETESSYTESEMHELWKEDIESGNTFMNDSFESFVTNCMVENNGTLITVKEEYSINKGKEKIFSVWNIRTDLF